MLKDFLLCTPTHVRCLESDEEACFKSLTHPNTRLGRTDGCATRRTAPPIQTHVWGEQMDARDWSVRSSTSVKVVHKPVLSEHTCGTFLTRAHVLGFRYSISQLGQTLRFSCTCQRAKMRQKRASWPSGPRPASRPRRCSVPVND